MNTNKLKLTAKKIYKFILLAPTIFKYAKGIWEMLKEIYNEETIAELEIIKEKL